MYNLLIGLTHAQAPQSERLERSRVLEYTSDDLKSYIAPAGPDAPPSESLPVLRTERLENLPALIMPEVRRNSEPQIARVGHIAYIRRDGQGYRFQFVPNNSIDPIRTDTVLEMMSSLGIDNKFELYRTHWAVKDVDLYRVLSEHLPGTSPRPTIFSLPTETPREDELAAVMMPFEASFDPVYQALQDGIKRAGMHCLRADDIWERDHIMDDIISLIWRSRVVVADLSGKNPNVFYETGIAHTLGRDTILVSQSLDHIPFDLRSVRTLQYHNNREGRERLAEEVSKRLKTIVATPH